MPIYEYRACETGCSFCSQGFERLERLSDPELTHCLECGAAVQRVISAPSVVAGQSHLTSPSTAEKAGFTQYRKVGKGIYEKTAGKGPRYISGD